MVTRSLNPFVTSEFSAHSLTAVTGIISSLFGGLSKLVFAKIMDTWGRPHTLVIPMLIWTIGFILMAACPNVEAYVAAQVFSVTGYNYLTPACFFSPLTNMTFQSPRSELLHDRLHL